MAGQCPHLGLEGDRRQVLLAPSSRHRCYLRGQGERIGSAYQASTCLTSLHRRCPRLIAAAHSRQQVPPVAARRDLPAGPARPHLHPTDLQPVVPVKEGQRRQPITLTEMVVMGLGIGIVLAFLFVGYALFYRLQVGPGMEAALAVTRESEPTTTPPPTLMPTFTPPPPAPAAPSGPPTPLPEPTLLLPTPVVRLPATSPPTRLVIPRLNLDIPVVPVGVKTIWEAGRPRLVWDDVPYAGGFHQTSAYPGNVGNTVINGHRDIKGAVFRHLDRLEPGDEITLYVGDLAYPYRVVEMLVVPETFASAQQRAENQRLIGYLPEERLTLVTCTPVGLATHRLLVIAKPPEQAVPQMPEAGSGANR